MTGATSTSIPAWARRSERALPRLDVPRVSAIEPGVLDNLRPLVIVLIARPFMALSIFVLAAARGWWPVAIVSTWLIYGSALTCVHHLIHSSLGLAPGWRRFWLSTAGALVLESGHALQVTHLAHHRGDAEAADPEGWIENVSWKGTPLAALQFRYRLALWGLRFGPRPERVRLELAVHAVAHVGSLVLLPVTVVPWIYLTLIHVASFAFAVLAGKGPQTNYGRPVSSPLIRVRTRLGRMLFFSHDQHLEHHAYPRVPLSRLRRLHPHLDPIYDRLAVIEVAMPL